MVLACCRGSALCGDCRSAALDVSGKRVLGVPVAEVQVCRAV